MCITQNNKSLLPFDCKGHSGSLTSSEKGGVKDCCNLKFNHSVSLFLLKVYKNDTLDL